nr:immunoglobulin light chain junction region [Macaca mulatta]MOV77766.1 immunoglobulin light chain junction region [Macaca mulatta]MOV77805.1 immunoglobulin light chain junction region [Macaca mulatta]MOV77807.1 immunoglobulin light chain junction region [Macaca mulatta]MOV77858.1 immunoglobulin light chain junction region [Macaca mulatta]
CQQYDSDPFTF